MMKQGQSVSQESKKLVQENNIGDESPSAHDPLEEAVQAECTTFRYFYVVTRNATMLGGIIDIYEERERESC